MESVCVAFVGRLMVASEPCLNVLLSSMSFLYPTETGGRPCAMPAAALTQRQSRLKGLRSVEIAVPIPISSCVPEAASTRRRATSIFYLVYRSDLVCNDLSMYSACSCFDAETGELLWTIPEVHRGGVTALQVTP